jgi:hypothetical protein
MTNTTANTISACSTLAIALLTAAYVWVSTRTLKKIERQAELSEDQGVEMAQQREMMRCQWRTMHEQDQLLDNMQCPDDFEFMEFDGSTAYDAMITPKGQTIELLGNGLSEGDRRFGLFNLTAEQKGRLFTMQPEAYLWAVGSIHYKDIYGVRHRTPFAYWWHVYENKFVPVHFFAINTPD